jgi:uncharacterized membrane protein YccC
VAYRRVSMLVVATAEGGAEGVAFITGAATIVAAAILAGVAAVTTNNRLTKQIKDAGERQERELAEAGKRQKRELKAEAKRQAAALAHARELADFADLRSLLDEAAVALNYAEEARAGLELSFTEHGRKVPPEPLHSAKESGRGLFVLRERLYVRLGKAHAIAQRFHEATTALLTTWQAVSSLEEDDDPTAVKASRDRIIAAHRSFERAFDGFTEAAVERAGTVPTTGGPTASEPPSTPTRVTTAGTT